MDANDFIKALEARASAAEIRALGLSWHNQALVQALAEANKEIERLCGRAVPVPQSPLEVL